MARLVELVESGTMISEGGGPRCSAQLHTGASAGPKDDVLRDGFRQAYG